MIEYNAKKLAAVAFAMSTEKSRYYLCGVYFNGQLAVATDGHLMTVAHDDKQDNIEGIYPISKKAHTAMQNQKAERVVIQDAILTVYDDQDVALHMEPCAHIDGTFPDWRRVCPSNKGFGTSASFSHLPMAKVTATAKLYRTRLSITGDDEVSPHYVGYSTEDLFSVLMPMRGDKHVDNEALPEWMNTQKDTK